MPLPMLYCPSVLSVAVAVVVAAAFGGVVGVVAATLRLGADMSRMFSALRFGGEVTVPAVNGHPAFAVYVVRLETPGPSEKPVAVVGPPGGTETPPRTGSDSGR